MFAWVLKATTYFLLLFAADIILLGTSKLYSYQLQNNQRKWGKKNVDMGMLKVLSIFPWHTFRFLSFLKYFYSIAILKNDEVCMDPKIYVYNMCTITRTNDGATSQNLFCKNSQPGVDARFIIRLLIQGGDKKAFGRSQPKNIMLLITYTLYSYLCMLSRCQKTLHFLCLCMFDSKRMFQDLCSEI